MCALMFKTPRVDNVLMSRPVYLFDVIVQCDDVQGRGQVCAG